MPCPYSVRGVDIRWVLGGYTAAAANRELRMAHGGIRVRAGSQPALPRHGEKYGEWRMANSEWRMEKDRE
jgi:hypothetical protein